MEATNTAVPDKSIGSFLENTSELERGRGRAQTRCLLASSFGDGFRRPLAACQIRRLPLRQVGALPYESFHRKSRCFSLTASVVGPSVGKSAGTL